MMKAALLLLLALSAVGCTSRLGKFDVANGGSKALFRHELGAQGGGGGQFPVSGRVLSNATIGGSYGRSSSLSPGGTSVRPGLPH
jgi:hypothetical protein